MSENDEYTLFASCPKGIERLLLKELEQLGGRQVRETVGGVYATVSWQQVYAVCLYSRLANRVVLVLVQQAINNADEMYAAVKAVPWTDFFTVQQSIAVDFTGTNNEIRHTHFGAMRVKDAVVDVFTEAQSQRPSVDPKTPDVQLYAHVRRNRLTVGIDVSGGSLHRRHYRLQGAKAPLKENLAAALVQCTDYTADDQRVLVDPMCGSGTLLIEALLQRLNIAAAVLRDRFGFEQLCCHQPDVWQAMQQQARVQRREALAAMAGSEPLAIGYDQDARMVESARANAQRAGVDHLVHFKQQALQDFHWPQEKPLLLLTNPPYGERLSERNALFELYRQLGDVLRQSCQGGNAWVLCSDDYLLKALSLQKSKSYRFYNGALEVHWVRFDIYRKTEPQTDVVEDDRFLQGVQMVENRLRKNQKKLQKWVSNQHITCYRVYDADMPEYAFALDCYDGQYQIAEYTPPKSVDAYAAFQRRQQFEKAVRNVFSVSSAQLFFKERKQQKGHQQYQKVDEQKHFFSVQEGNVTALVNLSDYLDTGLFLDHRPVRRMIAEQSKDKRFLNLFCYTAVATLHAAAGGAASSLSVDMSQTYLDWAARNFRKNRLDTHRHQLLQADVMQWLSQQKNKAQYDLIFLDPPSFSNSKRMQGVLDIQRDHVQLIQQAMWLLAPDGVLLFSNNRRDFKLNTELEAQFVVENIHSQSIDPDFERNPKIHYCWRIRHRQ